MPTQTVFNMEGATPAGTSVAGGVGTAGPALINANQVVVNTGSAVSSTTCVIRGSLGITFTAGSAAQSLARFLSQAPSTTQSVAFGFLYNGTPNASLLIGAPRSSGAQAVRISVSTTNTLTITTSAGAATVTIATGLVPNTVYWVTLRMVVGTTTTGSFTCNLYNSALTLISGGSNNAYNLGTAAVVGGDFGIVNTNAATGTQVSIDYVMFEDSTNELFPPAALSGSLSLSGAGSFTSAGKPAISGSTGFTGAAALGLGGSPNMIGLLQFTGQGSAAYSAAVSFVSTLTLSAGGQLSTAGLPTVTATLEFTGGGSVTLSGSPGGTGALDVNGSGSIVFAGTGQRGGVLALGGSGAVGIQGSPSVTDMLYLDSVAQLSFDTALTVLGTLSIMGSGTLTLRQTVAAHDAVYGSKGLTTRWEANISGSRWAGLIETRWNGNFNG